jgi:hypothetical protein
MYPGEVPHFRGYPSSDSLNLLARLVAEGVIRAEPPLFSEYTPAGLLIRLQTGEGFFGIKVEDYTGTPSYPDIATIQTQYMTLTQPAAGRVLLVPQDAGAAIPGIINLSAQHFGSGKKSADNIWSKGIYYVGPLDKPGWTGTLPDGITPVEGGLVLAPLSGASGSGASGSGGSTPSGSTPTNWNTTNAVTRQIEVVENVCPIFETVSGSATPRMIGITVQKKLVTVLVPASDLPGSSFCNTNPSGCCPTGSGSGGSGSGSGSGGSGSGSGSGGCCDPDLPTLTATFTGGLSALGTVTLTRTGSPVYSAFSPACGGRHITLDCDTVAMQYRLMVTGASPAAMEIATFSCSPFYARFDFATGGPPPCAAAATAIITA